MAPRKCDEQLLAQRKACINVVTAVLRIHFPWGQIHKTHIDATVYKSLILRVGGKLLKRKGYAWKAVMKRSKKRGKVRQHDRAHKSQSQDVLLSPGHSLHLFECDLRRIKNHSCAVKERSADRGEIDVTFVAIKQSYSQFRLEPLNLLRKRGL